MGSYQAVDCVNEGEAEDSSQFTDEALDVTNPSCSMPAEDEEQSNEDCAMQSGDTSTDEEAVLSLNPNAEPFYPKRKMTQQMVTESVNETIDHLRQLNEANENKGAIADFILKIIL